MKDKGTVMDIVTAGAAGFANLLAALLKLTGLKAVFGIVGAVLLFMALPPEHPTTGNFNRREFAARLAVAGIFSVIFGDWFVDVVNATWPALQAAKHPGPFWLAIGAPGWWITRWFALQLYAWKDKTVSEVAREVKNEVHP